MLAAFPFYNVSLGFGAPLIPPFGSLDTRALVMSAILTTDSFSVSHSFPLLVLFS